MVSRELEKKPRKNRRGESGNEEKLMALLTPLNVNCHASDGRKHRLFMRPSGVLSLGLSSAVLQQACLA
ncbi:poly [ADP-ribose] [Lates japonicus]|uniref:Poly [ADP-ribose] n=1 Tax=Lates japonicus TaxID=270547 RepID=A0AAD3MKL2_LATJO|nr:poly [ADP-ribose] [Lates japonicus]